jgi:LysM repeat protein
MRALLGNNCAKGCFIYLAAFVLLIVITSVGLGGLSAKFGAAQVQGNVPGLTVPSTDQYASAPQSAVSSVNQDGATGGIPDGRGGGLPPTPTNAPAPPTAAPVQAGPQPTSAPPPPTQGQGGTITGEVSQPFYIVQPGDSLWLIAHKFGVDIDALRTTNNISGDIIYPGQVLYLPTGNPSAPAPTVTAMPGLGSQITVDSVPDSATTGDEDSPSSSVPNMPDTGITSQRP